MDEKTAELRDLFVDATGSETVTERQEAERGTLVDRDDAGEAVRELVAAMRERYGFSTPLGDAAYARAARGRFDDADDAATAAALRDAIAAREGGDDDGGDNETDSDGVDPDEIDAETVQKARFDLHLVRESDREVPADEEGGEPPFAYADLKRLTAAGNSIVECAEQLDAQPDAVAWYAAVARTDIASTRANDRFRDAFRDLLTDADIEGSLASDAREDGLREATEDIETDVSL